MTQTSNSVDKFSVRGRGRPAKSGLSFVPSGFHDISRKDTWVCAICECYDPPVEDSAVLPTTEWIGCDCDRWYHKHCTKLEKIDESFSCKNVNLNCLPHTDQDDFVLDAPLFRFQGIQFKWSTVLKMSTKFCSKNKIMYLSRFRYQNRVLNKC